jgi:hypothetical protein
MESQSKEIDAYRQLAKVALSSGKYPTELNEATMLNIMLSARDLGIAPYKAINGGFYVVNGKISMSTALMSDRIRKEGHSVKVTEWTAEKCTIIGIRKDNGDSVKVEYTMQDAQLAGLTNSPTWKKFPKNMLYNRAMSTLARVLFSDVVGACYSEDEKEEIAGVAKPSGSILETTTTIEAETCLTEEQCAHIDSILCDSEAAQQRAKKICEVLKVESIYKVPVDQFNKIIKALEKAKGENNE